MTSFVKKALMTEPFVTIPLLAILTLMASAGLWVRAADITSIERRFSKIDEVIAEIKNDNDMRDSKLDSMVRTMSEVRGDVKATREGIEWIKRELDRQK